MEILNKISVLAKNVSGKTSEVIEINKLKLKIYKENQTIAECKKNIGEYCYNEFTSRNLMDPAIEDSCKMIKDSLKKIEDLQVGIQGVKEANVKVNKVEVLNKVACPSCGFENQEGSKYCNECGSKIA